jgi:hypothetical protein
LEIIFLVEHVKRKVRYFISSRCKFITKCFAVERFIKKIIAIKPRYLLVIIELTMCKIMILKTYYNRSDSDAKICGIDRSTIGSKHSWPKI